VLASEYIDLTTYAIPGFALLLALEVWWLADERRRGAALGYERRDAVASIALGVGSALFVTVINLGVLAIADLLWRWRLTDLGTGWAGWTVTIVGWDLAYYWQHRAEHEVRLLWACHVNHHSSQRYNLSTALRQPWTPWSHLLFYPWLALVGVRPWMILAAEGIDLIYQFWVHTEAIGRLPRWFELVFNTPSHHRVHHGSNPEYLDRNYGGILIVFDRLFGTFQPEVAPVRYGLTKDISTYNPLRIAFHEYAALGRDLRAAHSWRDRAGHVLRGPGWTPA
jgi:sterol desaturase/sphingolipid hydroxylase (fatty acid hydroxylase superfamily)